MSINNFIKELEQSYINKVEDIKPPVPIQIIQKSRFIFKVYWKQRGSKDEWIIEKDLLKTQTRQEATNQVIFWHFQYPARIYSIVQV